MNRKIVYLEFDGWKDSNYKTYAKIVGDIESITDLIAHELTLLGKNILNKIPYVQLMLTNPNGVNEFKLYELHDWTPIDVANINDNWIISDQYIILKIGENPYNHLVHSILINCPNLLHKTSKQDIINIIQSVIDKFEPSIWDEEEVSEEGSETDETDADGSEDEHSEDNEVKDEIKSEVDDETEDPEVTDPEQSESESEDEKQYDKIKPEGTEPEGTDFKETDPELSEIDDNNESEDNISDIDESDIFSEIEDEDNLREIENEIENLLDIQINKLNEPEVKVEPIVESKSEKKQKEPIVEIPKEMESEKKRKPKPVVEYEKIDNKDLTVEILLSKDWRLIEIDNWLRGFKLKLTGNKPAKIERLKEYINNNNECL